MFFHSGNGNSLYVPGSLVLLRRSKIEFPDFMVTFCRGSEATDFIERRNGRRQRLVNK
jgi:hypothetical protein